MKAILCFGDSIVLGRGDNLNGGWVNYLKKYFESQDYYNIVYNLGVPGESTTELLNRFEIECSARTFTKRQDSEFTIIVRIGTNDSRFIDELNNPNIKLEVFRNNVNNLIKVAKKYSSQIIFIGLTPVNEKLTNPYENTFMFNERLKQFNQILQSCCQGQVLFIDFFNEWTKKDYQKWLDDGLHPNAQGYKVMFKKIKEFLIKNKII